MRRTSWETGVCVPAADPAMMQVHQRALVAGILCIVAPVFGRYTMTQQNREPTVIHRWRPIEDLPPDRTALVRVTAASSALRAAWTAEREGLSDVGGVEEFNRRLVRAWSIETGLLEDIYTVERGVTQTLIEKGFDAAFVTHGSTNIAPATLIDILKDHERAVEGLFAFVKQSRTLTTSYVKELHRVLTEHQEDCDALDPVGRPARVPLIRGDWKLHPNNPSDVGSLRVIHQYCPPLDTAPQMDRLIAIHATHVDLPPEVSAAWLHHRFTQIHPFQDGNGRVARALATLVFIRDGGFPLVVLSAEKAEYIEALRSADAGDLAPLVQLFAALQEKACAAARRSCVEVIARSQTVSSLLANAAERMGRAPETKTRAAVAVAERLKVSAWTELIQIADAATASVGKNSGAEFTAMTSDIPQESSFVDEIIETSKRLDYEPASGGRRPWVRLRIRRGSITSLVISFHGYGWTGSGVMAASAFVTARAGPGDADGNAAGATVGIEPACTRPFTFTGGEDPATVDAEFRAWLDEAVKIGLAIWTRSL